MFRGELKINVTRILGGVGNRIEFFLLFDFYCIPPRPDLTCPVDPECYSEEAGPVPQHEVHLGRDILPLHVVEGAVGAGHRNVLQRGLDVKFFLKSKWLLGLNGRKFVKN